MSDQAFVVMQVGARNSPERKRADEIYNFIIKPALADFGIEPYRADLDLRPGGITPSMLKGLLEARLIIADLTGRNPNVFYELGIAHSFARPLISIADSASHLPFDAKDERVIELGEYISSGLTYDQGEEAKRGLVETLGVVLSADYIPPSPLREVAETRSVDDLVPDNSLTTEIADLRNVVDRIDDAVWRLVNDVREARRRDYKVEVNGEHEETGF